MITCKMAELVSFLQTNSKWTYSYWQISLPSVIGSLMDKIWIWFPCFYDVIATLLLTVSEHLVTFFPKCVPTLFM